jgi:hypothetical protein
MPRSARPWVCPCFRSGCHRAGAPIVAHRHDALTGRAAYGVEELPRRSPMVITPLTREPLEQRLRRISHD